MGDSTDNQSLVILDASKPAALKAKATIKLEGEPEGFAVDESRGIFIRTSKTKTARSPST